MPVTRIQLSHSIGKSRVCASGMAGSRASINVIRNVVLAASQQCFPLEWLPSQASFFMWLSQQLWATLYLLREGFSLSPVCKILEVSLTG